MSRPGNLQQLVRYVTRLHGDDERSAKYAAWVVELFEDPPPALLDALFAQEIAKELIVDFLFECSLDNPWQVYHWVKIVTSLLVNRTAATVEVAYNERSRMVRQLVRCAVQSNMIMELVLKLIMLNDMGECAGVADWLADAGLVDELVLHLSPNGDDLVREAACAAILELLLIVQGGCSRGRMEANALVRCLKGARCVSLMVSFILSDTSESHDSIVQVCCVLCDIFRRNSPEIALLHANCKSAEDMHDDDDFYRESALSPDDIPVPMNLCDLVQVMCDSVPDLHNLLLSLDPKHNYDSGFANVLGMPRLRLCELFSELFRCTYSSLIMDNIDYPQNGDRTPRPRDDERCAGLASACPIGRDLQNALSSSLCDHHVFVTLVNLFFDYPNHNIMHGITAEAILGALRPSCGETHNVALTLFFDAHLTDKICEAHSRSLAESNAPNGVGRGYMGHVAVIADSIVSFCARELNLADQLQHIISAPLWKEYTELVLPSIIELHSKPLGGFRPEYFPPQPVNLQYSPAEHTDPEFAARRSDQLALLSLSRGMEGNCADDKEYKYSNLPENFELFLNLDEQLKAPCEDIQ